MRRIDLTGQRFGLLTVLEFVGQTHWKCRCLCGSEKVINGPNLRYGRTRSCGCLCKQVSSEIGSRLGNKHNGFKHGGTEGGTETREYQSWKAMLGRCRNPHRFRWDRYGGAGVKVCDHWLDFRIFLADMGPRPEGTTLGRYGDVGNYEPGNCKWMTPKEQAAEQALKRQMGRNRSTGDSAGCLIEGMPNMATAKAPTRSPIELYKVHDALQNAQSWLTTAYSLSGDEDGKHIEAASAAIAKTLEFLQKQHNIAATPSVARRPSKNVLLEPMKIPQSG